MSITDAQPVIDTVVTVHIGSGSQIGVFPLHRGHHAIWASSRYQADICNMVDDLVVRDLATGLLYRFPIDRALMPWLERLVDAMDAYDEATCSPWACDNVGTRAILLNVAYRRIDGKRPKRNTLEPGMVAPAVVSTITAAADVMLAEIIAATPNALVDETDPTT